MKNRGFTLIELLVVIAIIGILSSVVLASLNSARVKASDAKVKSQFKNIVTAAEIYYSIYGNYGTTNLHTCPTTACTSNCTGFWNDAQSGLFNLTNPNNYPGNLTCFHSSSGAWAIQAQLSGTNNYWCVDNTQTNFIPKAESAPLTGLYCP